MPGQLAFLSILAVLTFLALVWAYIESRKPRKEHGGGMPAPTAGEGVGAEEAMQAALLASGRFRPKEWEAVRTKLRFVHDELSEEEANRLAQEILGRSLPTIPSEERDESEEDPIAQAPRERLRIAFGSVPSPGRAEFVGTFYAPGPFDVYRLR